jgi:N-acetyl-anhydromuramyl-L-alanine amidase AmpD
MKIEETNWQWKGTLDDITPNHIVIHHAQAKTCTASQIDSWHKAKNSYGIGYQYLVRKNGKIYRGRPEDKNGAHEPDCNYSSIGICCEGNYDEETEMPEAQRQALVWLCKDIRERRGITRIIPHSSVSRKTCPGVHFPFDQIVQEATA